MTEDIFNANDDDPNSLALSGTTGDDLWLTISDEQGNILSIVDDVHFRASFPGESLARFPHGVGRLAPAAPSLGQSNTYPRIGSVVISEVHYNPADPTAAAIDAYVDIAPSDLEFVEIYNSSLDAVDLTDWRLRGGVEWDFDFSSQLAPNESLVITRFDPDNDANVSRAAAFRAHHIIEPSVRMAGGYQGQLSGNGERLTLLSRDRSLSGQPIALPLVIEYELVYDNRGLWPTEPDGAGAPLHRRNVDLYGNLAQSWVSAAASPGLTSFSDRIVDDFDGNNLVKASDIDLLYEAIDNDQGEEFDFNLDSLLNQSDVDMLVGLFRVEYGDTNLDGIVDHDDFFALARNFGKTDGGWADGDTNGDGVIQFKDFVILTNNFD